MATKTNKNMEVATIDPTSTAGNSQRRLFCPLIEVPIMSPTIKVLKERRIILKASRFYRRLFSNLCLFEEISITSNVLLHTIKAKKLLHPTAFLLL
jgi:hypothetical protein